MGRKALREWTSQRWRLHVKIRHSEGANDRLDINTVAGTDTVDSSGLTTGVIQLFVDGAPA